MGACCFRTCSRQSSVCVVKEYREFVCLGCGLLIVLVDFLLERNRFTEKSYRTHRLRSRCKMMYSSRFYLWFLNREDIVFHFACISGVTKSEKTDWFHYVWYLRKSPRCYHQSQLDTGNRHDLYIDPNRCISDSCFSQIRNIGNILLSKALLCETKNPTTKCYLQ